MNLFFIDILQKLNKSNNSPKNRPHTPYKSPIYYEEMFDFNKSQEKFSLKPIKKANHLILETNQNGPEFQEKQFSPKCEKDTKSIKPLYICYNNSKFTSPLLKSNKKRDFDDLFEDKNETFNEENINPIDEFCEE